METKNYVCENLEFIRSCYGMTQMEMAAKIDMPYKSYQSYEERRCMPKLDAIIQISCKLNLTLDEIVKVNLSEAYTFQQILQLSVKTRTTSKTVKKAAKTK
jgi:DNA-binding XRE family transcriptional regulator